MRIKNLLLIIVAFVLLISASAQAEYNCPKHCIHLYCRIFYRWIKYIQTLHGIIPDTLQVYP